MQSAYIGVYWSDRLLSMGKYRELLRGVLDLLAKYHVFLGDMRWAGSNDSDLANDDDGLASLGHVVSRHSWSERSDICGEWLLSGVPDWNATSKIGFSLMFNNGLSATEGGVSLSVHAGCPGSSSPNCVVIKTSLVRSGDKYQFKNIPFCNVEEIFLSLIVQLSPDRGIVTSHEFSAAVCGNRQHDIGWLTYLATICCALTNSSAQVKSLPPYGSLFSVCDCCDFTITDETISLGKALRHSLHSGNCFR